MESLKINKFLKISKAVAIQKNMLKRHTKDKKLW
jgi:hypothetical protein